MLNGLSLFSGIGGIDLALAPWVRTRAYCENDRYAQAVLLSRQASGELPIAPIWDDVRTLRRDDLPFPVDIIFGGFPCQGISVAGHGEGLDDERSGLVFEFLRLIGECRPRFVFMENSPALVVRGLDRLLLGLHAMGFDARWTIVSAREVGACHRRRRFWIIAHANGEALRVEQGGRSWTSVGISALDPPNGDIRLAPWSRERGFEPRVFGAGYGIPFAVDRDRCLGNAVVPLAAREAFMRLVGVSGEING